MSQQKHGITEQWNGSSWTEVADLNTAQKLLEWVVLLRLL